MTTMSETLDETISAYTLETRAVVDSDADGLDGEICMYLTPDGKMCAVGRCMIDPTCYAAGRSARGIDAIQDGGLDAILKPEYRGFPIDFWEGLQDLHDDKKYWSTGGGLTVVGQGVVGDIRGTFNLGDAHDNDA